MKLFLTAKSERGKVTTKSGNEFIEILLIDENRKNIAQINFFYKQKTQEILTTFVPLNCQEYSKDMKSVAINTHTRRYCTSI